MTNSAAYEQWLRANQDKRGTPDYVTVLQAFEVALRREAGAAAPAPAAPAQRTGFGAALGRGFESLIGTTTTGVQAATGDANQAAELALKRAAASPYADQVSWDKVKEVYGTQGALAAAFEVARQAPLAIAEQLPQLGASLGATAAGAKLGALTSPVTGPVGPIVGGGLGFLASTMPSIFGSNIERQAAEQQQAGKPIDIDVGAAAGAAALQTGLEAAGTFIPLGRTVAGKLFGPQVEALLKQGKEKAAEALARESLGKMVAKGAAVGVAAEVPTEVVQQALERAQAGLPVLSDDALTEYAQAAYQTTLVGAPLGTAGRAVSRSEARTAQAEAAAAQEAEQRKAAREAAEAEKKTPEYLLKLDTDYQAAVKRMQELQAAVKDKPGKDALPDERVEYQQRVEELKAFTNETMRPLTAEYTPRKAEIAQLKERQRVEGMTPEEYAEFSYQEAVKRQPRTTPIVEKPEELSADFGDITAPVVPKEKVEPTVAYVQSRIALANSQQDADRLDPKDRAPIYAEYLLSSIPTARRLVQANEQLPDLGKRESTTVLSLVKEGLKKYDMQQAAKQQGSPIAQLEAEERAALEETERAEAERLAETEERRKLGPELTALQRMGASPKTLIARTKARIEAALQNPKLTAKEREALLNERDRLGAIEDRLVAGQEEPRIDAALEGAIRAASRKEPETQQPSAAIGQIQQLLSGEEVAYTGDTAPPPARELRRVPAEGLALFGESKKAAEAAPTKAPDVKRLRERIGRLLLNPDLSEEAYTLLRRADDLLPEVETRIETVRERKSAEGTVRDVAQTAGLLELLDKQVALIEQGQEGVPTSGRTLENAVRPVPVGARRAAAANIVEPTIATQDDVKLARQRTFANLVAQGFSPGEAAKRAFQIGKPTREAQEVPFERAAVPMLPPEPGQTTDVRRRFAGRITPMQPRAPQPAAPGPEAAEQPGRKLAPVPRVGTLRGLKDKTLTYQAEIEPLLQLQERVRAEDAGQLSLFPEKEEERGAIEATPAAFQARLEQLKAAKKKNADTLLSKEAQIQPLEEEIKQLEATLNVLQQKQKAFENAQFILSNNLLLLKELDIKAPGTKNLRGGMGALTFTEANLQQAANALDRQRVLLTNHITRLQKEKEQTGNLRTNDVKEIGTLLTRRAEDEARIQNSILASAEEIGRINALEQDIYNRQFPNIDAAKENARVRMRELHQRFGEASAWAEGMKTLRKKIQRQFEVAQESQRQFTANPELSQLVGELGRQLINIDNRLARNTALMTKIDAQVAVGVAEANVQTLKAEASPEAVANVQKQLVDARTKLNSIRAEVAKTTTKKEEKTSSAVAQAVEEKNYAATLRTHQRMLEAMQLRTQTGTIVPALSYVQRLTRDNPQAKFSVEEKDLLGKDPREVLDGLRSRVTVVERDVKAAVANSRGAEFRAEKDLINKYQRLVSEYEAAETAIERAQIEPELSATLKEYNAALNAVLERRVVWKGQAAQTAELLSLYEKIAYLENMLNYGLEPSVSKRYQPETPAEAAAREQEAAAIFASQREAQEGAGETTGEALTRSQVAKRRKSQKTVYSGKGVGPEELSKKDAEDLLLAQTKQADGQPLTKRDKELLKAQDRRDEIARENLVIKEEAAKNAVLRSAFQKKERKESLTPLEQLFYDEALSKGVTKAEEISLEEADAERAGTTRRRSDEDTADEDVAEQLADTFEARAGFDETGKFSRGPTANPSTTDSVRAELKQTFPDLGRVQIYDSVDALVAANPQYKGKIPADARGFVDSAGNKAFLIAENINQGQALSVLLHEVGAHVGLKSMLGDAQYSALVNAVKSWEKRTDSSPEARVAQAARARVEAAGTPAGQVNDELLAYAVEEAVNAGVKPMETKGVLGQWLSRVATLFRRALEKFGLPPKALDAQGLVDMAFGAAKMEMRGQAASAAEARTEPGEILFSRNLPTAARVANQIVGKEKGVIDKIRDNFLGIGGRAQFIDKYFPTEEALKRAGADPTKAMQAMYYLRMHDQRMHFTSQAITDGVPERREIVRRDGTKEYLIEAKPGANLKQAYDILKRKDVVKEAGSADAANKLVTLYMAAIRGERVGYDTLNFGRVWAQGEIKRIENELKSTKLSAEQRTVLTKRMNRLESRLDSMPTPEDIKAAKAEIDANPVLRDAFSEVRDIYNQYNRDLINFNVQTGALSKEQANKLLQENDYIPYYRMRDGVAELIIGKETPIRIGNLKDSPHLQELVGGDEPIMDFITSSIQNTSMLIDMATHNLAMKNLMFEFKDLGLATVGKVKGGNAPAGAVTFKLDGVEHFGVVDTEALGISSDLLVKGLAGIPTMFPAFVRVMGMPARFLRRMIVASPLYMARQLFRDSLAASIASGSNTVPLLSAVKQIGKTDVLERRGITGGQVFTGMPEDQARMIKDMQAGKLSITNGLAYLEGKAAQVDALTRRAQYESYLQQGLSEMEATYMALESMNFSRRGLSPSLHMASTLIPFFNAQIQGLDVLYRSFTGQMPMNERLGVRKKLIARGMMLFGLSIAYAMAMQDDEAYKNAKPEEKYGNWFVSLPGVEQPIRLPIPFELGYVFKALPEAIVNILANEEGGEEAFKALKHIVQQMIPGASSYFIPAAVKPLLEYGSGVSFYTGRDIESAREQAIEPGYRARESTTELAKAVGEMTGFSPIKLEFLISGYTGQMGMALIAALSAPFPGAGEGPAPATKRPSDLPLVGTLFQPKDASGIIDLVYERMNKVRQVQETYKRMLAENKPEQAKRYAEEKADELSLASVAGAFREQMGQITEFEREVRASTLTPDRKRAELDRARQAKIRLAQAVQGLSGRTAPQAARP